MKFGTHGNISEEMEVTTLFDYLVKSGVELDEEGDMPDEEWSKPENEILGKYIACEVAIYMMRRTAYLCGSTLDHMRSCCREYEKQYFELTGKMPNNFNKDIDW